MKIQGLTGLEGEIRNSCLPGLPPGQRPSQGLVPEVGHLLRAAG